MQGSGHCAIGGLPGPPPGHGDQGGGIRLVARDGRYRVPEQQLGTIHFGQRVGQRVGDALEAADGFAELLAFAGVVRCQLDGLAGKPCQHGTLEQLPFLDCREKCATCPLTGSQMLAFQACQLCGVQYEAAIAAEVCLRLAQGLAAQGEDTLAVQGQHRFGSPGARQSQGRCTVQWLWQQADHRALADARQQVGGLGAVQPGQQARRRQAFGQRRRGQVAARFLGHQQSVEQSHVAAAGLCGHTHHGDAQFHQSLPEGGVEAAGFGLAYSSRRGLDGE
ncbi:hypothetical protein D9M68_611590 [compost metagenome]